MRTVSPGAGALPPTQVAGSSHGPLFADRTIFRSAAEVSEAKRRTADKGRRRTRGSVAEAQGRKCIVRDREPRCKRLWLAQPGHRPGLKVAHLQLDRPLPLPLVDPRGERDAALAVRTHQLVQAIAHPPGDRPDGRPARFDAEVPAPLVLAAPAGHA